MAAYDDLARELRGVVGGAHVLADPDVTGRYRRDWTGRFTAGPALVVRPETTEEAAAIVQLCLRREVAIVPQGGNTGLVGGSVPLSGELVLSTERLAGVEAVTEHAGDVTARAGTPLAEVQRAALDSGWRYGVDIASRDSATIGGTVATNAGGLRVLRYGDTRRQLVGVEVVTGTGEVVSALGGTLRDNTGYHLPSLLAGSEGTLGVVTRVRVRLVPRLRERTTALVRFGRESDAATSAEAVRGVLPDVESAELFFGPGLELVCSAFGLPAPFRETAGGYLLVEAAGTGDPTAALADAVAGLPGVADVAVAGDQAARDRLWRYRELHTEAVATVGTAHKLDVALPPGSLAAFVAQVPRVVSEVAPGARTWLFGHGGESSVHVNVTGPANDDDSVDDAVLQLVTGMDGSISAEHGVGRTKLGWLGVARGEADLALLRRVKAAFDPAGIMNPAVLVPPR